MLVLTRKRGESIIITQSDGTRIKVTPVGILGNKVRVGIDAPMEYVVDRQEVKDAKDRNR